MNFRPDRNEKKFNMFEEAETWTTGKIVSFVFLCLGLLVLVRAVMLLLEVKMGYFPGLDEGLQFVIDEGKNFYERHFEPSYY